VVCAGDVSMWIVKWGSGLVGHEGDFGLLTKTTRMTRWVLPHRAKLQKAEALKISNLKGRESTKSKTDSTVVVASEEAKALRKAKMNAKGEFKTNEGENIDPERQIGQIGSQASYAIRHCSVFRIT